MGTPQTAKFQLSFYGAPQEAVDALLKVKECLDNISYLSRLSIDVALVNSSFFILLWSSTEPRMSLACHSIGDSAGGWGHMIFWTSLVG
jgi:hypothetical protein